MKHVLNFEGYLNENILLEKKVLAPATINKYGWNKNSANALKKWSYKLGEYNVTFNDFEFYGNDPEIVDWLSGTRTSLYYLSLKFNDLVIQQVFVKGNQLALDSRNFAKSNSLYFDIDDKTFNQYIVAEEDKMLGFINLLTFLYDKFKKEIGQLVGEKMGLATLYVIKAGKISPETGKTEHGWSIYDNPKGILGVTEGSMILYSAAGMKVGDKFKIVDDQKHTVINNQVEIVELIPATYKDFVDLSKRRGAVVPIGAFKKQPGKFSFELFSIK